MKKQRLSEIFSELNIPADKLPELYSKNEISYKNVQKKVLEKINAIENPEKKTISLKNKKRAWLGIGIAAALLAAGAGAAAVSNAGKNVNNDDMPQSVIDISNIETELESQKKMEESDHDVKNIADTFDFPKFSECSDVYNFEITKNEMKGVNLQEVKYFISDNEYYDGIYIFFHFVSDGTADFTDAARNLTGDFESFSIDAKYYSYSLGPWFISEESDSTNLYAAIEVESYSVDLLLNEYSFRIKAFFCEGYEKISDMGMKNIMGFTNAEINAKKDFTEKMKEQIADEYISLNNSYYKKEDVIAVGDISVNINISEDDVEIENDYISTVIQEFDNGKGCMVETDTFSDINADILGIRKTGRATEVLVRFMADDGYELPITDANIDFDNESACFYADKELIAPVFAKTMSVETYKDPEGSFNSGVPCILRNFTFITDPMEDLYFGYSCKKSGKEIQLIREVDSIGKPLFTDERSFTDDKGFSVNAGLSVVEFALSMPGGYHAEVPQYLDSSTSNEKMITLVTKEGRSYPVRMLLYKEEDGSPAAVGTLMTSIMYLDSVDRVEYNGTVIFTP
ncbi:MAG: hypothetical protein ACI4JN_02880 [Ruminococcus sp.]